MTAPAGDAPEAIPTPDDWGTAEVRESWTLDAADAYQHLNGKSLAEVRALFTGWTTLTPFMAFYFLPTQIFGFYVQALAQYLLSEDARADSQGAGAFLRMLDQHSAGDPDALRPHWSQIEPMLTHVVEHADFYEPTWEIDGDFRSLARVIAERGFPVSFATEFTELLPRAATPVAMARTNRAYPWDVAAQVWRNAGHRDFPTDPTRADIVRLFGPPSTARSDRPEHVSIPEWIRFDFPTHQVRFAFQADGRVADVWFLGGRSVPILPLSSIAPELDATLKTVVEQAARITTDFGFGDRSESPDVPSDGGR